MAEIAIFIKTFMREKCLYECVSSIKKYGNNISYKIYIADDGPISEEKEKFYSNLEDEGHIVKRLPHDIGASKSRNILLEISDEPYILRMDDDFCFCEETDIQSMKKILENNEKIGAVADLEKQIGDGKGVISGEINRWQGDMKIEGGKLIKKYKPLKRFNFKKEDEIKYAKVDFSRNMILFKREIFNEIKWEEKLKVSGEHADLLLQIKESSFDLVFTINSIHLHRDDIKTESKEYNKHRNRKSDKFNVYQKKWGIEEIETRKPFIFKLRSYKNRFFSTSVGQN